MDNYNLTLISMPSNQRREIHDVFYCRKTDDLSSASSRVGLDQGPPDSGPPANFHKRNTLRSVRARFSPVFPPIFASATPPLE